MYPEFASWFPCQLSQLRWLVMGYLPPHGLWTWPALPSCQFNGPPRHPCRVAGPPESLSRPSRLWWCHLGGGVTILNSEGHSFRRVEPWLVVMVVPDPPQLSTRWFGNCGLPSWARWRMLTSALKDSAEVRPDHGVPCCVLGFNPGHNWVISWGICSIPLGE